MIRKLFIVLAAIATLGASTITSAHAIGLGSAARGAGTTKHLSLPRAGQVAPLAYQIFCLRNRSECTPGTVSSVSYTSNIRAKLASVNRSVNRSIRPLNERRDVWSLNPTFGDCDDYVMTKRSKLIRAGVPSGALRVAVVRTPEGIGHAVLLVKTSTGEYVLDNLRSTIVKREQSGYRFLKIASSDPAKWSGN